MSRRIIRILHSPEWEQVSKAIWQKAASPFCRGGECIRPRTLGTHIRPRRQANNAQCTHA